MLPQEVLRVALDVDAHDIVTTSPTSSQNFNRSWRCVVAGLPAAVYVKVQRRSRCTSVIEEGEVLEALQGASPLVPRLLARGVDERSGRGFLVVSEAPGVPLAESNATVGTPAFEHLVEFLGQLARADRLRAILSDRAAAYEGPYSPGFDPRDAIAVLLHDQPAHPRSPRVLTALRCAAEAPAVATCASVVQVIHGSLTPYNVLCGCAGAGTLQLAAVLDFEAARMGSAAFDVALLAFYLGCIKRPALAAEWLHITRERDLAVDGATVRAFLAWIYLRRVAASGRTRSPFVPADADFLQVLSAV